MLPNKFEHLCMVSNVRYIEMQCLIRALDKEHIFISYMPISSPNPMCDHLLQSSQRDDCKKWPNIRFDEEITQKVSIEVNFMLLSGTLNKVEGI